MINSIAYGSVFFSHCVNVMFSSTHTTFSFKFIRQGYDIISKLNVLTLEVVKFIWYSEDLICLLHNITARVKLSGGNQMVVRWRRNKCFKLGDFLCECIWHQQIKTFGNSRVNEHNVILHSVYLPLISHLRPFPLMTALVHYHLSNEQENDEASWFLETFQVSPRYQLRFDCD